jgi:hypothetical protein
MLPPAPTKYIVWVLLAAIALIALAEWLLD